MTMPSRVEFDPAPSIASRQIIGHAPERLSLQFFAPAVGRVTLSNDPVAADGQGLVLAAGQGSILFRIDTHGDMVQRPWYALYSVGASAVSWVQTFP